MATGKLMILSICLLAAVVAVAVVAAVSSSGSDRDSGDAQPAGNAKPNIVQAGAPGEASRRLSEDELAEIKPPKYTESDVEFVRGMIHHHVQGIEMTSYVPDRSVGRNIRLLARRSEIAQESEIELMERWLEKRGKSAPDSSEHENGHGGELMPGMLTETELTRLEAARGRVFNRRFLRLMIGHHRGALTMVRQLRDVNAGLEPELDKLAREIEADQSIEIDRMRELLAGT